MVFLESLPWVSARIWWELQHNLFLRPKDLPWDSLGLVKLASIPWPWVCSWATFSCQWEVGSPCFHQQGCKSNQCPRSYMLLLFRSKIKDRAYLVDSKNGAKAVIQASPLSMDPKLDLPRWPAIWHRELMKIISCVLTTQPKLGNECHQLANNITSIKFRNRCSSYSFSIIYRYLYLCACINIKLILRAMYLLPRLSKQWDTKCTDKVACHKMRSVLHTTVLEVMKKILHNKYIHSLTLNLFCIQLLTIRVQSVANIACSHVIDGNIVSNKPA